MTITYEREKFSRGSAWQHLLLNKPVFESNGFRFIPSDHHFRKAHGETTWGWYVEKWRLQSDVLLTEAPCDPPPPHEEMFTYPYEWRVWQGYDGNEACGFVLGWNWIVPS